jgi:hypothetical protein
MLILLTGRNGGKNIQSNNQSCPQCNGVLRYIPEYNSLFCDSCQFYPYPQQYSQPHQPMTRKKNVIIFSCIVVFFIFAGWFIVICGISGGWILHSLSFTVDNDMEIDESLLNEIYFNLDNESRLNITNETYFLKLTIPELNYSIRFDYLLSFNVDQIISLEIVQHADVPEITTFDSRPSWDAYNLSIEFNINSTDPDILNVSVFPPDNIINGSLGTYSVDSWNLSIWLEEGEVDDRWETIILLLPHNQRIIANADIDHPCPFR